MRLIRSKALKILNLDVNAFLCEFCGSHMTIKNAIAYDVGHALQPVQNSFTAEATCYSSGYRSILEEVFNENYSI